MKLKELFAFLLLALFLFSCNKREPFEQIKVEKKTSLNFPERGSLRAPSSPEEIKNVEEVNFITPILLEVYKNPLARREVNAAIYSGYYIDESVMLKDLLEYERSPIYKTDKFRLVCTQPGVFASEFRKAISKFNLSQYSLRNDNYSDYGNIVIYFPYSESYQNTPENQLSLLPAEFEGNYGTGFEPLLCNGGICYDTIT